MKIEHESEIVRKGQRLVLPNTPLFSEFAVIFTFQGDWHVTGNPEDNSLPEQRVVILCTSISYLTRKKVKREKYYCISFFTKQSY